MSFTDQVVVTRFSISITLAAHSSVGFRFNSSDEMPGVSYCRLSCRSFARMRFIILSSSSRDSFPLRPQSTSVRSSAVEWVIGASGASPDISAGTAGI